MLPYIGPPQPAADGNYPHICTGDFSQLAGVGCISTEVLMNVGYCTNIFFCQMAAAESYYADTEQGTVNLINYLSTGKYTFLCQYLLYLPEE